MTTDALLSWGQVARRRNRRGDAEHEIERRFEFRPARLLRNELPQDFVIRFAGVRPADGVLRIVPADGIEAFLLQAGLLGQVILRESGTFDDDRICTSHVLRMVFQYRNRIRESFNRSFTQVADLVVRRGESLRAPLRAVQHRS